MSLHYLIPDANQHGNRDFFPLNLKCFFARCSSWFGDALQLLSPWLKIVGEATKANLDFLEIYLPHSNREEVPSYCDSYFAKQKAVQCLAWKLFLDCTLHELQRPIDLFQFVENICKYALHLDDPMIIVRTILSKLFISEQEKRFGNRLTSDIDYVERDLFTLYEL